MHRPPTSKNKQIEERYVSRLHDAQIQALVQSKRRGNYLLVGRSGMGKTSSLMALSNRLIDSGMEHQVIPCLPPREFIAPLARINLVDDLDLVAHYDSSDHRTIDALNESRSRSLNIVTARPPEADELRRHLIVDGTVTIETMSQSELRNWYEKLLKSAENTSSDNQMLQQLISEQIGKGKLDNPRTIQFWIDRLKDGQQQLRYHSPVEKTKLELVRSRIITLQSSLVRRIGARPFDLPRLSPIEFEKLIGELFEKEGYSVEFTKTSRDGGVDIFAWKRDIGGESLTVVQCKKYSPENPVRVGVVREVVGSMNIHNATAAAIFTTSNFTKAAVEESKKIQYRLSLNDYFDIVQSIARHQTRH